MHLTVYDAIQGLPDSAPHLFLEGPPHAEDLSLTIKPFTERITAPWDYRIAQRTYELSQGELELFEQTAFIRDEQHKLILPWSRIPETEGRLVGEGWRGAIYADSNSEDYSFWKISLLMPRYPQTNLIMIERQTMYNDREPHFAPVPNEQYGKLSYHLVIALREELEELVNTLTRYRHTQLIAGDATLFLEQMLSIKEQGTPGS